MALPWYYEIILIIGALACFHISRKRAGYFSAVVWAQIALYYALVFADAMTAETRHTYGRLNIMMIMLSEIVPYIWQRVRFWRESKHR